MRQCESRKEVVVPVNHQDPYSGAYVDTDPQETAEWKESLDAVIEERGHQRGREIMLSLLERSRQQHLGVPMHPVTDYVNTIAPEDEAPFPGDEQIERTYRRWIRWNAAVTVHNAQSVSYTHLTLPTNREV